MNKIIAAAALGAAVVVAAPAFAQTDAPATNWITGYGTLGYSNFHSPKQTDAITGRLGLRFGRFLGAEAEGSFGSGSHQEVLGSGEQGQPYGVKMSRSVAAYAVGYLPIRPNLDLFVRGGGGNTKFSASGPAVLSGALPADLVHNQRDSINYGGGAQYFLTGHDGIRADYTRESYTGGPGHSDIWGVSYVRKF